MKKIFILLLLIFIFIITGCKTTTTKRQTSKSTTNLITTKSSIKSNDESTSNKITTTSSIASKTTTKTTPNTTAKTTESKEYSIKDILDKGALLNEGEISKEIEFNGTYVKAITDNMDKLMVFVDENNYVLVRVKNGFDDYLKNRYLNCDYHVTGTISKTNGNVEVIYKSLENITSTPKTVDYSKLQKKLNGIKEIIPELNNITLNNKYNGTGIIVNVSGTVISTDKSDANTKAVIFDGEKLITIINDKKICDGITDIGKSFNVTGILNVLKGSPAILLLDIKPIDTLTINYDYAIEVNPSYFSKWYHVSDYINDPSYNDYMSLYKIKGYVNDDSSRTNAYYVGMTDNIDESLSDNGIKKSINGIYLMNQLNMSEFDFSKSVFYDVYNNSKNIAVYGSLYQFDTQNHGWKIFAIENTIEELTAD